MKVNCVWEHHGGDSILYADNFVGAFSRGASKEEAISKIDELKKAIKEELTIELKDELLDEIKSELNKDNKNKRGKKE